MTHAERARWIERGDKMPLAMQCELAGVPRSPAYRRIDAGCRAQLEDAQELELRKLIDEEYISHPFYGSRRMVEFLRTAGQVVNRKRVQRLMRSMGLAGMAPGPNTSKAHPQHKVYPITPLSANATEPKFAD